MHRSQGRVKNAAVPVEDIRIIETTPHFLIWIDIRGRSDLAEIYQQPFPSDRHLIETYWIYDTSLFYLMIEVGLPALHDLLLSIPVQQYWVELTFLSKSNVPILITPGPPPQRLDTRPHAHRVLSIPLSSPQRTELLAELLVREQGNNSAGVRIGNGLSLSE